MIVYQYSNSIPLCVLLIFVSSVSFLASKPTIHLNLWNPEKIYLTPLIYGILSAFIGACTIVKGVRGIQKNLRKPNLTDKKILAVGNALIIAIATTSQVILYRWNWHIRYSFGLFILSNIMMATVFIVMLSEYMLFSVANYKYEILIPVFTYTMNLYILPYTGPGDSWLYNFYFNSIIAVCANELHAVITDNIRLDFGAKIGKQVKEIEEIEDIEEAEDIEDTDFEDSENSDIDYSGQVSSDEDWEKVEDALSVY